MTPPAGTPALRYAYGTNGLADLRLPDALALLAGLGYDGVGLTLDHMHLDPLAPDLARRTAETARLLGRHGLTVTVETGARYVLDPRRKHGPTLLDADPEGRAARLGLLRTAVRVAADLGAHAVHCFSGVAPPDMPRYAAWQHLTDGIGALLDTADTAGVAVALEPEPGHLVGDLAGFHRLRSAIGGSPGLGLTLDVGHCQCLEPATPAACVRDAAPWLRHVQIEDMRRGVHEHLPFGEGEIDFPPVLGALREAGYAGLVTVELPRHSHAGPDQAAAALPFLHAAEHAAVRGTPPAPAGSSAHRAPAGRAHPAAPARPAGSAAPVPPGTSPGPAPAADSAPASAAAPQQAAPAPPAKAAPLAAPLAAGPERTDERPGTAPPAGASRSGTPAGARP
ncbi:sugar phosphate isomerase/epimerase [Streptomyces sp. JJ36]|uniref:sugar phosphate isomerase/epimerase family protein n=1 Tax=Streptomyces sp. JJ36 TaxID=2736645 RepID=UPI001F22E73C|nr:sugar phosphate isomerase/epimerase family protein [Streptomyces sp. JJ36]MCF6526167.1 sugar phosphate isomerase/epimerase [Streptomyces sp. JJ36]